VTDESDRRGSERKPDLELARLAVRQHGQVRTDQLRACGLTKRMIATRAAKGRLWAGPRGVWSVGTPPLSDEARCAAAVLAVRGAVLAGRSAAHLWGLWRNVRSREVVIGKGARDREDVRVLQRRLDPQDVTTLQGIPITTVARTLLDLAGEVSPEQLRKALARARVDHWLTDNALRDVLARHPRVRGTRRLGEALAGPMREESDLERRLSSLLGARRDRPRPRSQVLIGADRCDFVWPEHRLVVEVDGPQHAGDWAKDAAKDARLRAAGWTVLRFTAWDVERDGAKTLARIERHLRSDP
jgi:very-short-patch-repair endonuclease